MICNSASASVISDDFRSGPAPGTSNVSEPSSSLTIEPVTQLPVPSALITLHKGCTCPDLLIGNPTCGSAISEDSRSGLIADSSPPLHSSPYLAAQPYEYPNQGYYHLHPNVPRFAASLYPASQRCFFTQRSAEELKERECQQTLAIISNHHCRRAEKEAAIRRQQQAEVVHQRYLVSLAAELEQQRQHAELLASRHVEVIRAQQARACLATAEHQLAMKEFFCHVKGVPSVRRVCTLLPGLVLIISQKATVNLISNPSPVL
jgi:hypothetical protein